MRDGGGRPLLFHRESFKAMGSPCDIQIYAATHAEARRVARSAIADVQRLESRYSRYRSDSLLSDINRVAAMGGKFTVDEEAAGLLNYAATAYRESGGLFDITSGILRRAWRFDRTALPDQNEIDALLTAIGWDKVHWEPPRLEFTVPGMEIDFGGVVKEYAVDRVAALCRDSGIRHGFINLGGDIKIIGPHPDGTPWRVGIRHPRDPNGIVQRLNLSGGGLASSGDYERCIVVNGVRYSHVLNPKTGWPVRHLAAVSVWADFCLVAGSASTIAMLKEDQGPAWLEALGAPCIWVDGEGNVGGSMATGAVGGAKT